MTSKNEQESYIISKAKQYFAFNIWSIESAEAVMDGAFQMGRDVILQTSMKAFEAVNKEELRAFVTSYMDKKNIHAYLHLDHSRDMKPIREAIDCGWDSVMIDASDKTLEENIEITNEVYGMAKKQNVLVEAEIGQIPRVSEDINGAEAARIEDIERFVKSGHMDILAAAIGTTHGLYRSMPKIHYDLIEKISEFTDIPLAIHGGTGLTDDMLLKLLSYRNVKKINISTEVKLAYWQGLMDSIESGDTGREFFDPLKVEQRIHDSIESIAVSKLKLLRKE